MQTASSCQTVVLPSSLDTAAAAAAAAAAEALDGSANVSTFTSGSGFPSEAMTSPDQPEDAAQGQPAECSISSSDDTSPDAGRRGGGSLMAAIAKTIRDATSTITAVATGTRDDSGRGGTEQRDSEEDVDEGGAIEDGEDWKGSAAAAPPLPGSACGAAASQGGDAPADGSQGDAPAAPDVAEEFHDVSQDSEDSMDAESARGGTVSSESTAGVMQPAAVPGSQQQQQQQQQQHGGGGYGPDGR